MSFNYPKTLTIATRESPLAWWQAHFVASALQSHFPAVKIEFLGMTTQGDRILDVTLNKIGGKGLFVKELETALFDGRADLAVHSLKDVPMMLPEGLTLAAVMARHDARDALVSNRFARLEDLPAGSIVGTSSLRREAQIRARLPHLEIRPLRGNVQTRLRKLDEGEFDAIILAAAGLERLGLSERITQKLDFAESLPAAGQGALGIEIAAHRQDLAAMLSVLHDAKTWDCVRAERTVSRVLGGSCQLPLAAFAEILPDDRLQISALLANPDGSNLVKVVQTGARCDAEILGEQIAEQLKQGGALDILKALQL